MRRVTRQQLEAKTPGRRVELAGRGYACRTGSAIVPTHAEARASLIRGHLFDVARSRAIADNFAAWLEAEIRDELVAMALRRIAGQATRALFEAAR